MAGACEGKVTDGWQWVFWDRCSNSGRRSCLMIYFRMNFQMGRKVRTRRDLRLRGIMSLMSSGSEV